MRNNGFVALLVAVGIPAVAVLVLKDPWHALLRPWLASLPVGPGDLAAHLLYGLPAAILSLVAIAALRLGPWHFRPTRQAVKMALLVTVASLLVTFGFHSGEKVTTWGVVGNLASTFYEELTFRALVVLGVLRWKSSPRLAILIAGLVFTLPRLSGPWQSQLTLFLLGALYAATFLRHRNLFGPWLAHTLTDLAYSWSSAR